MTLRLLGGLTTTEIARALLVPEPTMAQRLARGKGKIRDARIPYLVPKAADLPGRLGPVLAVVYLIFNEGFTASSGDQLIRDDLCAAALRLGRLLAQLMPKEPEVMGLLALMLLVEARRAARTTRDGSLVLLAEQDRGRWDRVLISEGHAIVQHCIQRDQPGPYQIQAAINGVHTVAPDAASTDWRQILLLYDQLLRLAPSPVVALNRAVAVAEVVGPDAALELVDNLDLQKTTYSTPSGQTCYVAWTATLRRPSLTKRRPGPLRMSLSARFLSTAARRSPEGDSAPARDLQPTTGWTAEAKSE